MSAQGYAGMTTHASDASGHFDVAVIGAGMSGIRAASLLAEAGRRVVVIDKGQRHGGRMSTRRVDDATFDTGAIAFTAHSTDFRTALADWIAEGLAQSIQPETGFESIQERGVSSGSSQHWRGAPTMRSLPTALASRLGQHSPLCEVRLATRVSRIGRDGQGFQILLTHHAASTVLRSAAVVLTTPAPQSIEMLVTDPAVDRPILSPSTMSTLEDVTYIPSLTVLVRPVDRTLEAQSLRPVTEVGPSTAAPDLLRIHRNEMTGASGVVALTLQADPTFSAAHLDSDPTAAAASLAAQASTVMGTELEVVHVHAWRYAQVLTGIDCGDSPPALIDRSSGAPLVLAGDLFATRWPEVTAATAAVSPDGVERAFLSGTAAAELLLADGLER